MGMVNYNYEIIEKNKLHALGELARAGGGNEILKMVEDANADSKSNGHSPCG
jgi:hypothetical protein